MKNRKKLRRQIARLTAIFYLLFVTTVNMAVPGTDSGKRAVIETKAASSVTVTNADNLKKGSGAGCNVTASVLDNSGKIIGLTASVIEGTFLNDRDQIGFYSVKDNTGKEYFYTNQAYDGTTPGLYYDDGWKVVCDSAVTSLSVRLIGKMRASNTPFSVYNSSASISGSQGTKVSLDSIKSDLESTLNNNLTIYYYDYDGSTSGTATYTSGVSAASGTQFGYDNLFFLYNSYDSSSLKYVFNIGYGGLEFVNSNDVHPILNVWKGDTPTISAYRESGTNQLKVFSNLNNPTEKQVIIQYFNAPNGKATGTGFIKVDNNKLKGTFCLDYPEEGIYLAGSDSPNDTPKYYCKMCFGVQNASDAQVTTTSSYDTWGYNWSGPKEADLGNISVNTSKNLSQNLKCYNGENGDYFGEVISVKYGETTLASREDSSGNKVFYDDYVCIDTAGNVMAIQGNAIPRSYTVVTQTKYTKLKKVAAIDDEYKIVYDNGTTDGGKTVSDIQYGYQDWEVSLTVTPTGSASEATTTTEKITEASTEKVTTTETPATTTTQAPTTQAPATTTQAPSTQEPTTEAPTYTASLTVSPSDNNVGSTTIKNGSGASNTNSVTAKAGDTITITTTDNDYNKSPVVEYTASGTTKTAEGSSGTYTFTMPAADTTVNVWYKTISSVTVTSSSVSSGGTKQYGTTQPTKADLARLCSASANYVDASKRSLSDAITLSEANVTLGTATYKDSGVTRTYTVPVTVSATRGGKTGSFAFNYTYTENIGHAIALVTGPQGVANETTLSTTAAAKGTTVTLTVTNTATACDPTVYYKAGTTQANLTKSGTSGSKVTYTFTMPDSDVTVYVTYKTLSSFTVTAPSKTAYSGFTQAQNLDVTGGSIAPTFTDSSNNTYRGSAVTMTSDMLSLGTASSKTTNGTTVYTVPVHVTYNAITVQNAFSYTYQVVNKYGITCSSNGSPIQTDVSSASYGDTITVTVPKDSSNQYVFSSLAITTGTSVIPVSFVDDTTRQFTMPAGAVTVTATYLKITDIEITPPTIALNEYQKNTIEEDMPLASIEAVYGSGSSEQRIEIPMTLDHYTVGTSSETVSGTTVTVTVPVTITVNYGGLLRSKNFSYQYTYEKAPDSKTVTLGTVTPSGMHSKVNVSKTYPQPEESISVTATASPKYAFAQITVTGSSSSSVSVVPVTKDGTVTGTFTMPAEDVTVTVAYRTLSGISLTAPTKTEYDSYMEAGQLDYAGGSVTAVYGSDSYTRTISMETETGVENGCAYACLEDEITNVTQETYTIYTVPVQVSYGGFSDTFSYTYKAKNAYTITLNTTPTDCTYASQITLSTDKAAYGDTVQVVLPPDTDEKYMFVGVTYTVGGVKHTMTQEDGAYSFTVTGNTTVTVEYSPIKNVQITVPDTQSYNGYVAVEDLDISGISAKAVYENGEYRSVPILKDNVSYGTETTTQVNGCITHRIPVIVALSYGGKAASESYTYTYTDYNVVLTTNLSSDTVTSISKSTAKVGDILSVTLDANHILESICINGAVVAVSGNPANILLDSTMVSDKGFEIEVNYKLIQSIEKLSNITLSQSFYLGDEITVEQLDFGTETVTVYYGENKTLPESVLLNSDKVTKKILFSTDRNMGDYTQRTLTVQFTIDGKSVSTKVIVKLVEKPTVVTTQEPTTTEATATTQAVATTEALVAPGTVVMGKVTSKSKKITAKWDAQENATSYEVYLSTSKNSGYQKIKTVKAVSGKSVYSYTIQKWNGKALKKGKKYYIKIRAVNGTAQLSKQTTVKSVKCKKNGKLSISIKGNQKAVSYQVSVSLKKTGYKKVVTIAETGKKKYTTTISKCGSSKVKKGKKYYVRVVTTKDDGNYVYGPYSKVVTVKCK